GALAASATEPTASAASESVAAASAPSPLGAASASLRAPTVGLRAIEAFRRPTGKDSANLISEAYWQSAARDFEVASLQPSAPARWRAGLAFAKGEALVAKGAYDEADAAMRDAMAADPEWSVPHAGRAIALARKDAIEPALAEAREAERLEPDWIGGPWMAARVYARASKFYDAIQEYQRALVKDEKNAALLGDLAICYHGAHMDSEAERFSKRALEADPELASVHLMMAELALEKGDGKAALDHASQAVAILPTSASARLAEADAYALLKKADDARRAYDKAVALYKELGGAGEIATRLEIVEKALAKGEIPPLRGERKKTDRSQSREVHERSACSPGDPLCGVDL
ncbi:MAG TPA: hypothetical protein VL400_15670, partial [Polyangiaceae bacterium]|nr:hypothetical protein [Polyangiaceae bacterium]